MCRVAALVLLFLVAAPTHADERPAPALTPSQAADKAAQAAEAGDSAALKALAAKDDPDPWMVADELCYRGAHHVAEAFANAAPRVDVEKLPPYVSAWRKRDPDKADRDLLAVMNAALAAGRSQEVVDAIQPDAQAPPTVVRVRLLHARGVALGALKRFEESAGALEAAAAGARTLGWLARASALYRAAGMSAVRASLWGRAAAAFQEGLVLFERLGHRVGVAGMLTNIGSAHMSSGDAAKALAFHQRALAAWRAVGDAFRVEWATVHVGVAHQRLGDFAKALPLYARSLELAEARGDKAAQAGALINLSLAHRGLGQYPEALSHCRRGLALAEAISHRLWLANANAALGSIYLDFGDYPKALASLQRALEIKEALRDKIGIARTLGNIAGAHTNLGHYAKALSLYRRSLDMHRALRNRAGVLRTLGGIGGVYHRLGDYAQALSYHHRALENRQDKSAVASTLSNIGLVHEYLGDYELALSFFQRSLAMAESVNSKAGVALALVNMGLVHVSLGAYPKARSIYERALELTKALGNRPLEAAALENLGVVHQRLGAYETARGFFERSFAISDELGKRAFAAGTLANLGVIQRLLGRPDEALETLKDAVRRASTLRSTRTLVLALKDQAALHLAAGDAELALVVAQRGLRDVELLLGGLGEEEGASARAKYDELFAVGTLAAVRSEDLPEALAFLESGRAGALLESLGGRQALRWTDLPAALRDAEAAAKADVARARHGHRRALAEGTFDEARRAGAQLDEALNAMRAVAARIQRDAKKQAGLFYPRAATIDEIKGALAGHQALCIYGLCGDEALAMILRRDGERTVSLGSAAAVESASEGLAASDPGSDSAAPLAALRKLLIEPLKLGDDVRHVIVSPTGPLGYVPFGALFDRPVSFTPSGTTHMLLLQEQHAGGEGVLALGDPDYKGRSEGASAIYVKGRVLTTLAATRTEVEAIGKGGTVLLGPAANEEGLRRALGQRKRWRVLHLACHGLVDRERPTLSSLALSSTKAEDGFLTALEVLRMDIPADLAVLSACETGTGKVVKGEGIVGLTRAFMYAGASRVLCSLWKVDDEATKVLMIKFYELWNARDGKRLDAAAALREAQQFVRSHEKWAHPYYWAAWVLWGLP